MQLSPVYQTSTLESFHSPIIHFSPQYPSFFFTLEQTADIVFCVVVLFWNYDQFIIMDYNQLLSNSTKIPVDSKLSQDRRQESHNVIFSRFERWTGHVVRKIPAKPTYGKRWLQSCRVSLSCDCALLQGTYM